MIEQVNVCDPGRSLLSFSLLLANSRPGKDGVDVPIVVKLGQVMAERKMSLKELSSRVGLSNVNMSRIKTGKAKAIRFTTLELICEVLDCTIEDILEYEKAEPGLRGSAYGERKEEQKHGGNSGELPS